MNGEQNAQAKFNVEGERGARLMIFGVLPHRARALLVQIVFGWGRHVQVLACRNSTARWDGQPDIVIAVSMRSAHKPQWYLYGKATVTDEGCRTLRCLQDASRSNWHRLVIHKGFRRACGAFCSDSPVCWARVRAALRPASMRDSSGVQSVPRRHMFDH